MVHITFLISFSCHIQLIIAKVIGKNEVLVASQNDKFSDIPRSVLLITFFK